MASPGALRDPIWTTGVDTARLRSGKVRLLLLTMFSLQVVAAMFHGGQDLVLLGLDLVVFAIVAYHALRVPPATSLVQLSDALPLHATLLTDIHALAQQVGVSMAGVPVLINRTNLGASPCVRSRKRPRLLGLGTSEPLLEIPVGFLQVYQRERPAALAVLAHELAHIRHRDWESWAFTSAAASMFKWIRLPVACAVALWAAAGLCDFAPAYVASRHHVDNARDYAEFFADQRAERAAHPMSFDVGTLMNPGLERVQREMRQTPDEKLAELQTQLVTGIVMWMSLLLMPLTSLLLLRWILRLRKATEIAADRIAALTTSPAAVRRALTMFDRGQPRWQWLSAHPSIQSRLAALAELDADSAVPDTAAPPRQARAAGRRDMSASGPLQKWLHPANRKLRVQRTVLFGLPLAVGGIGGHVAAHYLAAGATETYGLIDDAGPSLLEVLAASLGDMQSPVALAIGAVVAIVVLACLASVRSVLAAIATAALAGGVATWWLERMAFVYLFAPELSLIPEALESAAVIRAVLLTALPLLAFLLTFDRMLARHAPLPAYTLATVSSLTAFWLVMVAAPSAWTGEVPQFTELFSRGLGDAMARFIAFAVCILLLSMPTSRRTGLRVAS